MKINSTDIIYPSKLDFNTDDVGGLYTSISGKTIVDIIRSKRVLDCGWNALTPAELKTILTLLADKVVNVTYYEPALAAETTKQFVATDIKFDAYTLQETKKIFNGLTVKFTEV